MADSDKKNKGSLLRNPISYFGILIFVICTSVGLSLMFIDMLRVNTNPYTGIWTYLVLPALAGVGVAIVALGMLWEHFKRRRDPDRKAYTLPRIDLNRQSHRFALAGSIFGLLVILSLFSITGYRAYHFSDSVEFCGRACHTVMKPEYNAYKNSPHARVSCVACHIGPGVGWFVRSKISGLYQVYSVTFNKYHRPIETPIKNLRPAQETCEQCHWPAKFFGAQQKTFTHYLTDERNSPWQIQTLLKIGGGDPRVGVTTGIHWHMNIKNKILYIDTDGKREIIPWVRSIDPQGNVTDFISTENPLSNEEIKKATPRQMDCMDCHNRPSHIFSAPNQIVDQAFNSGRLDPELPFIKREAMKLLADSYETEEEAKTAMENKIPEFYQSNYPEFYRDRKAAINQAVDTLQTLFSINIFPEMKTDWRAHTDHIGHLTSDGCFRCHDGLHVSQEGKMISNDCNACHTILAQGPPKEVANAILKAQPFQHPVDLGFDVTIMKCSSCHTGTTGL